MHRNQTGYHDPSVRFEAFGGGATPQPTPAPTPAEPIEPAPKVQQNYTVKSKLKDILQGEKNSIKFYNALLELENINENQKSFLISVNKEKENNIALANKLYTELISENLELEENSIAEIKNIREAFSFALLQEVEMLRDLNMLTINVGVKINPLINAKIADIAGIIGIMGLI